MRKLIFGINITLDGCCDHTKQFADEETHEYWTAPCEKLTCSSMGARPMN